MTDEQLASLRNIADSLSNVASAVRESFKHAAHSNNPEPLQPLDVCLPTELRNLRREGQDAIADALVALRSEFGSDA
jgi:hypothetical protein